MFRVPQIPRVSQPRYKKLKQEDGMNFSSDEEVLYDQQPQSRDLPQSPHDRDFMFSSYDVDADLSLPKESSFYSRTRLPRCTRKQFLLFMVVATVCAAILAFLVLYLFVKSAAPPPPIDVESIVPSPEPSSPPHRPQTTAKYEPIEYTLEYRGTLTEATPEFADLNGDGNLDVVMTVGRQEATMMVYWQCYDVEAAREACMEDFGFYPCGASVVAVDGKTGKPIWTYRVGQEVFAVTCAQDLNRDHIVDCMACGRSGIWHAVDGKTGKKLWDVDRTIVNIFHNFYFPLVVEDLDKDGTVDFVNMHGGDPRYNSTEHDRPPARLLVVSGKTGQKLMDPLLVPDMKESYMNPVRYATEDNDFILFGSGGETAEGGLWAVTVKSLKERVEAYTQREEYIAYNNNDVTDPNCLEHPHKTATLKTKYAIYSHFEVSDVLSKTVSDAFYETCPKTIFHPVPNKHKMCIYRVTFSPEKGVILPPVIIDMNGDNIDDLVISLYAGHTMVMDGSTGGIIWDRYIPGTESYSVPAPLYFNEDNVPDLFIRVNKGAWDTHYNYSYVGVVDGRNGKLLWVHNSSEVGFMSGTTLRAKERGQDAFLFMTVGELPTRPLEEVKALEVITMGNMTPHQYRKKRNVSPKEQQSFSPTEELDNLLGFRTKRDTLSDLTRLLNSNFSSDGDGSTHRISEDVDVNSTSVLGTPNRTNTSEQNVLSSNIKIDTDVDNSYQSTENPRITSDVELKPTHTTVSAPSESQQIVEPPISQLVDSSNSETEGIGHSLANSAPEVSQTQDDLHTSLNPISSVSEVEASSSSSIELSASAPTQESSSADPSSSTPLPQEIIGSTTTIQSLSMSSLSLSPSLSPIAQTSSQSVSTQDAVPSSLSVSSVQSQPHASQAHDQSMVLSSSDTAPSSDVASSSTHASPSSHPSHPLPSGHGSVDLDKMAEHMQEKKLESLRRFELLKSRHLLEFWDNWNMSFNHNPKTDPTSFLKVDCGSIHHSNYIYFLSANMIKEGQTDPIYIEKQKILFPDMSGLYSLPTHVDPRRRRRHEGGDHEYIHEHHSTTLDDFFRDWGCHHTIHPSMVVSTPSFVDVNGDGHIEIVYVAYLSYTMTDSFNEVPNRLSTNRVYVKVVTLEEALKKQLGTKVSVDLNAFLPYSRQPWTKYMGSNGDSHYNVLL